MPLWQHAGARHFATQAEVICGLLSPNVFPDAVLSDHPERLRALWVDSSNPVNTAADTARVLQAMRALDLLVVVDVAFTESAAQAHYVLPAASTYEKCELTLFNFEVPTNYFHVRAPVLPPLPGTLPEPEIYGRLARALGLMPADEVLAELAAKAADPMAFGAAFNAAVAADRNVGKLGGQVLYETLGRSLPDGTAAAAPLWMACHRLAKMQTQACAARCRSTMPCPCLNWANACSAASSARVPAPRSRCTTVRGTGRAPRPQGPAGRAGNARLVGPPRPRFAAAPADWPFVLSAGQRRLNNANQILRDPATRASLTPTRALYIHPLDLDALGVPDAGAIVVETARVSSCALRPRRRCAVRPCRAAPWLRWTGAPRRRRTPPRGRPGDQLADRWTDRDLVADTPHHKHVPVRLHAAPAGAQVNSVMAATLS